MSMRNSFSSRSKYYVSLRSLIFSAHNFFSGFWNTNSVKIWTYRGKFLYYVPIFSSVRTYTKKNICYVPCKCHNRTFLPPLHLYVPFDSFRRTFWSSFCLYVPCSCHSRTFLPFSRLYVPLPYAPGYFSTFILYMSRLILSAGFYVEQKCFAGKICISVCFNNQKSGKYTTQCITASVVFCFSASSAICFPVASI